MNSPKRRIYGLLTAIAITGIIAGCGVLSGKRLEPGGAYAPMPVVVTNNGVVTTNTVAADFALFTADQLFRTAYTAIDGVFKLESDNRTLLWKISPNIKHKLDELRPQANNLVIQYGLARTAYLKSPNPSTLNSMNDFTVRLQALLAAATAVMPK